MRSIFCIFGITSLLTSTISEARTIQFADRKWRVKSGYWGPGDNYWSAGEKSVWVDTNGYLHLKIRNVSGTWYCAEVSTQTFTRYGIHRFYINAPLDSLDKNVIFAPFLYKNDSTEIDIEFSRWGEENPGFNSQYVVQPWNKKENLHRFLMELKGTHTSHYINWQSSSVKFKSIYGHYPEPPDSNCLLHQWLYKGNDIPHQSENLRIHINLWLMTGNPPSNGKEVEVVITDADLPPPIDRNPD
ncbi:MAG: hypothetical protein U9N06_02635 [candidate division WOR-3 bacterium]|nr:hypothetical protein [candidate division WOR-3 bacterium]